MIYLIFCSKKLYDEGKGFVDFEKKMMQDMEFLKQKAICQENTPQKKEKVRVQVFSILKHSSFKKLIFANKKKDDNNDYDDDFEDHSCPALIPKTLAFN